MTGPWIAFIPKRDDLPTKTLTKSTYSHPNGTSEQDIPALTFTAFNNDIDASLDMTNITQNTRIRLMEKVDAVTFEQIKEWEWPTDNDNANDEILKIAIIGHSCDVKITITSLVAEGAARDIEIAKAEYVY